MKLLIIATVPLALLTLTLISINGVVTCLT
jgi:hypothetical protein